MINFLSFSKKYFFAIFTLSVIFVLSSIFWTTDIPYSQEDMAHIQLGFPLDFYLQDSSQNDISYAPKYRNVGFRFWHSSSLVWPLFFLDIIIMQVAFTATLFFVYSLLPRADYFFKILSVKYILLVFFLFLAITIGPRFISTGNEQLQSPGVENPVMLPPPFVNPAPVSYPAN